MSRSESVAVVEGYLNGLAIKDLSSVRFAPGITFEGPRMPKLAGRETVVGFLTSILPFIKGIEIKQHIVDGNYAATVFDMETVNGMDHVVDLCLVVDGELTEVRAFYNPSQGSSPEALDDFVSARSGDSDAEQFRSLNQLVGSILEIAVDGLMAKVVLGIDNQRVTAIITADAIRDLVITPGDSAIALFDAFQVMVCRP